MTTVPRRTPLLASVLSATLALAGCVAVAAPAASPSPSQASGVDIRAEAQVTSDMLELALAQYSTGDAELALSTVRAAYIFHFELVEHTPSDLDDDVMHELEELISETIREQISAGASVEVVTGLINHARTRLADALDALEAVE